MLKYIAITLSFILTISYNYSFAAKINLAQQKILVDVSGAPITETDVKNRVALIIRSTEMPENSENQQKLMQKALEILIDESLIKQEMHKLKINVANDEVDDGFEMLAHRNQLEISQLHQYLREKKIDINELKKQITTQIGWSKVINQVIRPKISVSEQEIARNKENIKNIVHKESQIHDYHLKEIVLFCQNDEKCNINKKIAHDILEKMSSGGDFAKLARQFSQSESAKNSGDVGWVNSANINPEIAALLKKMEVGGVDIAISDGAIHILKIADRKTISSDNVVYPSDEEIFQYLSAKKTDIAIKSYLKSMHRNAYINFFNN